MGRFAWGTCPQMPLACFNCGLQSHMRRLPLPDPELLTAAGRPGSEQPSKPLFRPWCHGRPAGSGRPCPGCDRSCYQRHEGGQTYTLPVSGWQLSDKEPLGMSPGPWCVTSSGETMASKLSPWEEGVQVPRWQAGRAGFRSPPSRGSCVPGPGAPWVPSPAVTVRVGGPPWAGLGIL